MTEAQEPAALAALLGALRRRRLPMLACAAAIFALSLIVTWLWPSTYRSTGTILIEQQELPPDMVRSAISSFADQRIQVITQRVMTTENLFKIIQRYDLYAQLRQTAPREKVIKRMRDDINFSMISADVIDPKVGRPTKATIAFSVSYSSRSPEMAARVANELVSLYLQVNIDSRRQDAANATSFLSDESKRLSDHIDELQQQIAAFKEKHLNDLPDQSLLNTQLMNRADEDLRDTEGQIRSIDQQIGYLTAQIAQISPNSQVYTSTGERVLSPRDRLKYLRTQYATESAIYSPTHPDVLRLKQEIEGLEKQTGDVGSMSDIQRQLEDTQGKLATAQQKYSADYPDVVRLKKQVAELQAELQTAESDSAPPPPPDAQADNPAYIEIKAQKESSINQRAALQQKRDELKLKIADFEQRLAAAPAVERDYTELNRELENTQLSYREVRQKQIEAQESEHLEDERKGERFTLIEPPLPPEEPASPNRKAIAALGLLLALAGAFACMRLLEIMDTTIRNRRDLEMLLTVPPLAIVPWIENAIERRASTRRLRLAAAGMATMLVASLVLIHFFYRPLDVLWQVAVRRFGG